MMNMIVMLVEGLRESDREDKNKSLEDLQDPLVDPTIANPKRVYDPEINLNVYDMGLVNPSCSNQRI